MVVTPCKRNPISQQLLDLFKSKSDYKHNHILYKYNIINIIRLFHSTKTSDKKFIHDILHQYGQKFIRSKQNQMNIFA